MVPNKKKEIDTNEVSAERRTKFHKNLWSWTETNSERA